MMGIIVASTLLGVLVLMGVGGFVWEATRDERGRVLPEPMEDER